MLNTSLQARKPANISRRYKIYVIFQSCVRVNCVRARLLLLFLLLRKLKIGLNKVKNWVWRAFIAIKRAMRLFSHLFLSAVCIIFALFFKRVKNESIAGSNQELDSD